MLVEVMVVAAEFFVDPAGEGDRVDQVGGQGGEGLVQGAEGDTGDEALVGLGDLGFGARDGLDGVEPEAGGIIGTRK